MVAGRNVLDLEPDFAIVGDEIGWKLRVEVKLILGEQTDDGLDA